MFFTEFIFTFIYIIITFIIYSSLERKMLLYLLKSEDNESIKIIKTNCFKFNAVIYLLVLFYSLSKIYLNNFATK